MVALEQVLIAVGKTCAGMDPQVVTALEEIKRKAPEAWARLKVFWDTNGDEEVDLEGPRGWKVRIRGAGPVALACGTLGFALGWAICWGVPLH